MRLPRIQITVRRLMVGVGICAFILWFAPIAHDYWWTWTVVRDIRRGQSMKYSPQGYLMAGPRSVQALLEAIRRGQNKTRVAALRTIGQIGLAQKAPERDLAKPAIPDLTDALRDTNDEIRLWAAIAVGQIGPGGVSAVKPLLAVLRSEQNPQVIASAIQSLGEIGPGAKASLPVLTAMVQKPEYFARVMATQAFWRVGPKGRAEASIAVPIVVDQLVTGKTSRMRSWAAEILCEMGPSAKEAIPTLSTAAADFDPEVCLAARKALDAIKAAPSESQGGDSKRPPGM